MRQVLPERVFVVHIDIPRYTPLAQEHRDALWRWLTRGSTDRRLSPGLLTAAKISEITVSDGRVWTSFSGIVSSADRLRRTLDALRRLASDRRV